MTSRRPCEPCGSSPPAPDVPRVESSPVPSPRAGESLVRPDPSGVNFIEVYKRTGLFDISLPATLDEEGAGTVVSVGEDVSEFKAGQRVAWAGAIGSYAEYAVVPVQAGAAAFGGECTHRRGRHAAGNDRGLPRHVPVAAA